MIPAAQHVPFLRSTRTLKAFHDDWLDFNQDAYEKVKGDDTYPISHLWQAYQNGGISKKEVFFFSIPNTMGNLPSPYSAFKYCGRITLC